MAKSDNSTLVLLGVGAAIAYYLYTKASAAVGVVAKAADAVYQGTVTDTSDVLTDLFGPAITSSSVDYIVTFPDGSRNAIPANTVDASGNFTWTGYPSGTLPAASYQIQVGSDGTKYAIATS